MIKAGKPYEKTFDGEKHLKDIRQLTFGGENAEAYFSPDGTKIIYPGHACRGAGCDQEYMMDLATGETKLVSSGKGRTTCGYFRYPKGDRIVYATTEGGGGGVSAEAGLCRRATSGRSIRRSTSSRRMPTARTRRRSRRRAGYDAEMTWCHQGREDDLHVDARRRSRSVRDGRRDGKVKRLTNAPGYDGGAFYNADCTRDRLARQSSGRSRRSTSIARCWRRISSSRCTWSCS